MQPDRRAADPRRRSPRRVRRGATGVPALCALALGACDSMPPERDLVLSGFVLEQETGIPIPGAVVSVFSDPFFSESRELLGSAAADSHAHYELTAGSPPGYGSANCSVMEVTVEASGYQPLLSSLDWHVEGGSSKCSGGGTARADFRLTPDSSPTTAP